MNGPIQASDYGVVTDGSDCRQQLTAAIQAAAALQTVLMLPAGLVHVGGPIRITLNGKLAIRGLGRRLSYLQFDGSGDGLTFDGSQGKQLDNYVELSDFALVGNANSGTALSVDFGTTPIAGTGSDEVCSLCHLDNLEIINWTDGIYLRNLWNGVFTRLFLCGGQSIGQKSGPGSGAALTLAGCISDQLANITATFWTRGIFLTQAAEGYACQGIQVSNYVAEAVPMAINNDTPAALPDGSALPVPFQELLVSNFGIDNGNTVSPLNTGVSLHNCEGLALIGGQILQKGGPCQLYLQDCVNAVVQGVDFTRQDNSTGSTRILCSVCLDGASSSCVVANNQFGQAMAVLLTKQTAGNRVQGNAYGAGGNTDQGKGNSVETG